MALTLTRSFRVHGLALSLEQVELSWLKVRRRLSIKTILSGGLASVCLAQKPVLEASVTFWIEGGELVCDSREGCNYRRRFWHIASTCHERQLLGVSEEPTLGLSPLL